MDHFGLLRKDRSFNLCLRQGMRRQPFTTRWVVKRMGVQILKKEENAILAVSCGADNILISPIQKIKSETGK